jgi:RNA methyltransferase, TrmH family
MELHSCLIGTGIILSVSSDRLLEWGLIIMDSTYMANLLEKYKAQIKRIGGQNDKIRKIKKIVNGKCPDADKLFSVEGIWAHQILKRTNIEIKSLLICPEFIYTHEAAQLVEVFIKKAENVYVISKKVMENLSERDKPDGMITIGLFPVYRTDNLNLNNNAVIVILDGLEQPGNIGTILRTCDGAGVDAVFVCNKRAKLTNPKLIKGSMGAVFFVPIVEFTDIDDCITWLNKRDFNMYLTDTGASKTYKNYEYEGNIALIIGGERYGTSKKWYGCRTRKLSIPMFGICDSLNVGTATSVLVYEICMKKSLTS